MFRFGRTQPKKPEAIKNTINVKSSNTLEEEVTLLEGRINSFNLENYNNFKTNILQLNKVINLNDLFDLLSYNIKCNQLSEEGEVTFVIMGEPVEQNGTYTYTKNTTNLNYKIKVKKVVDEEVTGEEITIESKDIVSFAIYEQNSMYEGYIVIPNIDKDSSYKILDITIIPPNSGEDDDDNNNNEEEFGENYRAYIDFRPLLKEYEENGDGIVVNEDGEIDDLEYYYKLKSITNIWKKVKNLNLVWDENKLSDQINMNSELFDHLYTLMVLIDKRMTSAGDKGTPNKIDRNREKWKELYNRKINGKNLTSYLTDVTETQVHEDDIDTNNKNAYNIYMYFEQLYELLGEPINDMNEEVDIVMPEIYIYRPMESMKRYYINGEGSAKLVENVVTSRRSKNKSRKVLAVDQELEIDLKNIFNKINMEIEVISMMGFSGKSAKSEYRNMLISIEDMRELQNVKEGEVYEGVEYNYVIGVSQFEYGTYYVIYPVKDKDDNSEDIINIVSVNKYNDKEVYNYYKYAYKNEKLNFYYDSYFNNYIYLDDCNINDLNTSLNNELWKNIIKKSKDRYIINNRETVIENIKGFFTVKVKN